MNWQHNLTNSAGSKWTNRQRSRDIKKNGGKSTAQSEQKSLNTMSIWSQRRKERLSKPKIAGLVKTGSFSVPGQTQNNSLETRRFQRAERRSVRVQVKRGS